MRTEITVNREAKKKKKKKRRRRKVAVTLKHRVQFIRVYTVT